MMYKGSLFFCQKLSSQVYSTGLKFPQNIFTLTLFMIILQTTNCKNSQGCPEQKIKNESQTMLNVDKFLKLIRKQSPSFKFLYNFHLSLHLLCIFFQSFFFFAIFPLPRKCFLCLFSFSISFNCKVASQLIFK